MSMEHWIKGQAGNPEAVAAGNDLLARFGEVPLRAKTTLVSPRESLSTPEQLVLRPKFTDVEKERLLGDGAKVFTLSGTTIPQQKEARKGKPSFWYVVEAGDRLLALPSREEQEVAIFPDVGQFFVEGTFGQNTNIQERLVRAAGNALAYKLGLKTPQGKPTIAGILTKEAVTWSDLTFQYLDDPSNKAGIWLFGPEYARAQGEDWVYGRTKNPTNAAGSFVAYVGDADPEHGLEVDDWARGHGLIYVGGPLLVVPIENQ